MKVDIRKPRFILLRHVILITTTVIILRDDYQNIDTWFALGLHKINIEPNTGQEARRVFGVTSVSFRLYTPFHRSRDWLPPNVLRSFFFLVANHRTSNAIYIKLKRISYLLLQSVSHDVIKSVTLVE